LFSCVPLARYHRADSSERACSPASTCNRPRAGAGHARLHFLDAFIDTLKLPADADQGFRPDLHALAAALQRVVPGLRGLGADLQWAWSFLVQMLSLRAGNSACCRVARGGGTDLGGAAGAHGG
jgi:hypothetical protein